MGIKLTSADARAAGYRKINKSQLKPGGIKIETTEDGYICYIGPCEEGTGAREVCYYTENGCDDCYLEDDPQCT